MSIIKGDEVFQRLASKIGDLKIIVKANESLNSPGSRNQDALAVNALLNKDLALINFGEQSMQNGIGDDRLKTGLLNEMWEVKERNENQKNGKGGIVENNIYQIASAASDFTFVSLRNDPDPGKIFQSLISKSQDYKPSYTTTDNNRAAVWTEETASFAASTLNKRLQFYFGENILSSIKWTAVKSSDSAGGYILEPQLKK